MRYLSNALLNITVSQPDIFLIFMGNLLNKRGPLKGRDEDRIVFTVHGAVEDTTGILQSLPILSFW